GTRAPDPDRRGVHREERGDHLAAYQIPDLEVPEELADVDRDRLQQTIEFVRIRVHDQRVVAVSVDRARPHPHRDPAAEALLLVSVAVELRPPPDDELERAELLRVLG